MALGQFTSCIEWFGYSSNRGARPVGSLAFAHAACDVAQFIMIFPLENYVGASLNMWKTAASCDVPPVVARHVQKVWDLRIAAAGVCLNYAVAILTPKHAF